MLFQVTSSTYTYRLIFNLKLLMTVWFIIKHSRDHSPTFYPWVVYDLTGFKRRLLLHCHFHGTTKFFCLYETGVLYQFLYLPMELTSSPRIFTKALRPVFAHLRGHDPVFGNVRLFKYPDKAFCVYSTLENCIEAITEVF